MDRNGAKLTERPRVLIALVAGAVLLFALGILIGGAGGGSGEESSDAPSAVDTAATESLEADLAESEASAEELRRRVAKLERRLSQKQGKGGGDKKGERSRGGG